jgi:crotonobetainyl-CoA:carnitine CoA-transferase CaiB-like acyl-CoA transferase
LSARHPGLVYGSISAYVHTGPDSHRAGFGLIAEAKSGIMAMVGNPGEAPPLLRVSLGDMYTGIHGVASICAALLGRVKSGKGQHIDLSLYDCLVSMHDYAVQCYTLSNGKDIPVQTGQDMPQSTLYGVFTATDGYLVIAAQVDDAWKRFAKLAGGAAFAADTRFHTSAGRNENRLEILAVAKAWVGAQTVVQCLAALDAIDVPCAKVQNIAEVLEDPQIIARGMVLEQDHPVLGKIKLPNLPFRFMGTELPVPCVAPDMGQHNREIASDLGLASDEIDAMVRDGVLYSPAA